MSFWAALLWVWTALPPAQPAVSAVPEDVAVLLAVRLITEPGFSEGFLELPLQNRSDAVITAWGVKVSCAGGGGRGASFDGWVALERANSGTGPLDAGPIVRPRQTLLRAQPGCGPKARGVLPVSVTLTFVVLEDGRWAGDPREVGHVFATRTRTRERWIEVLTVMEAVRRSFSGREALETLRARLTPLSDPQAIDAVTDTLRSIARALDDFQPVQLAPDLVLDRLIEEARLQVDAAARHLRADPPL
jgi:hypothetical protein